MKKDYICDIEGNGIDKPTRIWVAVLREVDNPDNVHVFRNPDLKSKAFNEFLQKHVKRLVGHNFIDYDYYHLSRLIPNFSFSVDDIVDTLVLSRLVDYNIKGGHSLDAWAKRIGKEQKSSFDDFTRWSQELEDRCVLDTKINLDIYNILLKLLPSSIFSNAISLEHFISQICKFELNKNGFQFKKDRAERLHYFVSSLLSSLKETLQKEFPAKSILVKEVNPKLTKKGTLHQKDFRWLDGNDLTPYSANHPFSIIDWEFFNPRSHKQIMERLYEAGWKPFDKTKGHIEAEKERDKEKLEYYKIYGWKVNEQNLSTLPETAPEGARKLAEYLLLDSRRSTLEEWLRAVQSDSRIHGKFHHIGAWTHRMSHSNPNQANIPRTSAKLGKIMRSLWTVPRGSLLVGCDAVGIQNRVFAHYINSEEFTKACLADDVHTANLKALGLPHLTRNHAKTFYYAFLLGVGNEKAAKILECSVAEAKQAKQNFFDYYPGLKYLKEEIIPKDAEKGYFVGFDGRYVKCNNPHLMMAGYLQNGEAVIMKMATRRWYNQLKKEKINFKLVDFVHDEWQTESVEEDPTIANYIGTTQCEALRWVGEELNLHCPMDGDFTIGQNWKETH